MEKILELQSISKSFPGVKALDDISLSFSSGEVRGLVGENGAGKSTLLKILSGAYEPSAGTLVIDGQPVAFRSTKAALQAGIAVIYQELNLVPEMSVAENLLLGHMPTKRTGLLDTAKMTSIATTQLGEVMESIDPNKKIKELPIAQRQMIEISKALLQQARIIAFDEPTSSLSDKETKQLFNIIRQLKKQGKVVIYVSHRMEEIFEICDSVTVFRDGKHIETFMDIDNVASDTLVNRMVGRDIQDIYNYQPRKPGAQPILDARHILCPGLHAPVSFHVKPGEIIGFFGLVGSGRTELMKGIYGATRRTAGKLFLDGKELPPSPPRYSIEHGLAFIPEDRKDEGVIPIRSVEENINISARRNHVRHKLFLNPSWEKDNAEQFIEKLSIKTPSRAQQVGKLSGGNQQKIILARWLSEHVKVLIMDEPTRGIDVGTKNEIYTLMYRLASQGMAIICVSSDLPEVMGIADRLVVMREGRIVATMDRSAMDKEKILALALPDTQRNNGTHA